MAELPLISVNDIIVSEAEVTATFTLSLSHPATEIVSVDYETFNQIASASLSSDYVGQAGTISFNPGETTKTVVVSLTLDDTSESDETFGIELSNPTNALLTGDNIGIATIVDNDGDTAPEATEDSYNATKNTTLTVNVPKGVRINDSDREQVFLDVSLVTDVSNGSLTLNEDGSFEYTPNANFVGTDNFTYQVSDDNQNTDTATATITVKDVPITRFSLFFGSLSRDTLDLSASDSSQLVFAGAGGDSIDATGDSSNQNRLYAGSGNDSLKAGSGDRLFGGIGNDTLDASSGGGGNFLYGGGGDDSLIGGSDDVLLGGAGIDRFVLNSNPESLNIIGDLENDLEKIEIPGSSIDDVSFANDDSGNTIISVQGNEIAKVLGLDISSIDGNDII
jgi:Ca2+-binding RTX toxin-like protein